MKHRSAAASRTPAGEPLLLDRLHRQAAYRWIALFLALAFLVWLWMFAGQARNPDGVKRQWAVMASRVLAAAGALFLIRLLMFTHEERIPVAFVGLRKGGGADGGIRAAFETVAVLQRKGHEVIPLSDVVMFIRAHRFLPKKCFGLVMESGSPQDLDKILAAAGNTAVTVIVAPDVLKQLEARNERPDLPGTVSLGTVVESDGEIGEQLNSFAEQAQRVLGRRPEYAVAEGREVYELRTALRSTGYTSFLGGGSFNRFGDEDHSVRLMDLTSLLESKSGRSLSMALSMALFKGRYIVWPLAAICRRVCA